MHKHMAVCMISVNINTNRKNIDKITKLKFQEKDKMID